MSPDLQTDTSSSPASDRYGPDGSVLLEADAGAAALVTRGVVRALTERGLACLTEFTFADGRRADVIGLDSGGKFTIVEVKSCLNDFRTDQKWRDYLAWCDSFAFAVDERFPADVIPAETGLLIADGFGAGLARPFSSHTLAPARRKALTLRFARAAALRAL